MTSSKPALAESETNPAANAAGVIQSRKPGFKVGLVGLNGTAPTEGEAEDESVSLVALGSLLEDDDLRRLDLAQRLHKDVAGGLVACTAVGEMIRQDFAQRDLPAHISSMLGSMDSTLRQALQVVRELTETQFPPVLKAFGLSVALQQLVRDLAENFVGALVLHIKGQEPAFDPTRRIGVYRMLEMLLGRCVRSSQTSWAEVTCFGNSGLAEFTIDYDGDEALWASPEYAVDNEILEARCALLGASFEVTHSPTGRCHRLILTIPLANDSAA